MSDQSPIIENCRLWRREFLLTALAAPAVLPALVATPSIAIASDGLLNDKDSAQRYDRLLTEVHPLVRYVYRPIPEEKNAWPLWEEAKKKLVPMPQSEADAPWFGDVSGFTAGPFPQGSRGKQLSAWLDRNIPLLKLVDQGTARRRVQIPLGLAKAAIDAMDQHTLVIRELADVRQLLIKRLLSQDKLNEAADHIDKFFEFAQLLAQHDTYLVYRLTANHFVSDAVFGMRLWASHPKAEADRLRGWIDKVNSSVPTPDLTAGVMRVEFCCYLLAMLAAIRPTTDIPQLVEDLLDQFLLDFAFDAESKKAAKQDRERRRGVLVRLLSGHVKALDVEATVRAASSIAVRAVEDLRQPWQGRTKVFNQAARDEMAFWPIDLSFLNDAYIVFREDQPKDPRKPTDWTDEEIGQLGKRIQAMQNPVGRLLIAYTSDYDVYRPDGFETRLKALRLVLAIRLYEIQRQKRPASLSDLVASKCIEAVPRDPFGDGPFSYSQQRGVVWSVGQDGKGNGEFVPTNEWDRSNEENLSSTWRVLSPKGG